MEEGRRAATAASVEGEGQSVSYLMDGDSVLVAHLIELVNADDATVGEDHGPTLEVELPTAVPDHRRRETGGGTALPRSVHADGRHLRTIFSTQHTTKESNLVATADIIFPKIMQLPLRNPKQMLDSQSLFHR